jgi:hypothetical protein
MSRSLQVAIGEGSRGAGGVDYNRDAEASIDLIEKRDQGEATGTS